MKAWARRKLATPLALLFLSATVAAHGGEPLDLVKSAVERSIALLKDPQLKGADKKKERVERLKEIINPLFDYEEMARRTLAVHWRRRTPAEQQEFVKLLRSFLEKMYSDKTHLNSADKLGRLKEISQELDAFLLPIRHRQRKAQTFSRNETTSLFNCDSSRLYSLI